MSKKKSAGRRVRPGRLIAAAVFAALVLTLGWLLDRSGWTRLRGETPAGLAALRISEVQNHNVLTLRDAAGDAPAWIEIENAGDAAVSLRGVCLARDEKFNKTFVFPDMTLEAGGFALVLADGKASTASELHAAFSLPAAGGSELYLFDAAQRLLDGTTAPRTEADASWCRDEGGEWTVSEIATPGAANRVAAERNAQVKGGDVELSELMSANTVIFPDEDGVCGDYIEVRNRTDHSISLGGYWLSDSAARPDKWQFPEVTLPAGGYLAVHCSGRSLTEDANHLHAGFKLSEGETVYLAEPGGAIVSAVTLPELADGQALSLTDQGWVTNLGPTPNMENTYEAAARTDALERERRGPGVIISEMAALPEGNQYDWVEVYNPGDADIDLGGWGLSDNPGHPRKWQFPEGTILPAQGYQAVLMTGTGVAYSGAYLSAPFALSGEGG
ncbi:MAG: lamin tail domain-containing protein, partial [Clostridia bacterium]|nr:lamin tail domain-containing protein [Clostridia bacterium]